MSSLILLRHGQASFGAADYDRLSPLGAAQATATGAYFAAVHGTRFDAVWTGPKRRHADTAQGVLAALGPDAAALPPQTEPALDEFAEGQQIIAAAERHFGVPLHGDAALPRRAQLQHYDALIDAWARGDAAIDGCRDAEAFCRTVAQWLRRSVARPGADQRLLAVTSAGTIGAIVSELLGLPATQLPRFTRVLRNASLTEVVFSPGRGCNLLSFNGVAHLPPALHSAI